MLGVTIHLIQNGGDFVVGAIHLVGNRLEVVPPDNHLLQEILTTPVGGDKFSPRPVSAVENPIKFLSNLQYHYKSAYLRASAPHEVS